MLIRSAISDSRLLEGWYEVRNVLHRFLGIENMGVDTNMEYLGGLLEEILQN